MKKKQSLGALALCAAAALILGACGGGNAPAAPSQQSESSSQVQSQSQAPESTAPSSQEAPAQGFPVEPEWVAEPKYDTLNAFQDSEFTTAQRDGDWYLVDKTGRELKKLPYDEAYLAAHVASDPLDPAVTRSVVIYSFMGGLAKVDEIHSDGNSAALGFIDETGEMVIDLSTSEAERQPVMVVVGSKAGGFGGDVTWTAPASVMAWNQDTFRFIDKTGAEVFRAPEGTIYRTRSYSEGMCGQIMEDGSIRYLDAQGKVAFTLAGSYTDCGDMKNGYAWFTTPEGKEGLMDRSGKVVLEPIYNAVGDVNEEGVCSFEDAATGLKGLMKTDGTVVLPAQYQTLYTPREGVTYFSTDGTSFGLINPQGEVVVEPRYQSVLSSFGGMCLAKQDGKWGFFKNPLA